MLLRLKLQRVLLSFLVLIVPVGAIAGPPIEEFDGLTGGEPVGITSGPDGHVWFTQAFGQDMIGSITTSGTMVTEIPEPNSQPFGITVGPDKRIWFTSDSTNTIKAIDPNTGQTSSYALSIGGGPQGIAAGPDGNLWYAASGAIGRITPTGIVTEFPLLRDGSAARFITAGPDGNMWFTEVATGETGIDNGMTGAVGVITMSGVIQEFLLPTVFADPRAIAWGPDGNLWFTERAANKIGFIDPATKQITEFPITRSNASPEGITWGPDGNIWFTERNANRIGRFDVASENITELLVPTNGASPLAITLGPDRNLWFTEQNAGKIGKISFPLPPLPSVVTTATIGLDLHIFWGVIQGGDGQTSRGPISPQGPVKGWATLTAVEQDIVVGVAIDAMARSMHNTTAGEAIHRITKQFVAKSATGISQPSSTRAATSKRARVQAQKVESEPASR
ncbi:Vgb family protein [Caballeronia sp. KNU42]